MTPLKHTMALASFATSAFLFVPSAYAAGTNDVLASGSDLAAPVSIAVISAAAIAGFVGWGRESRKYHKLDEEFCRLKMQMGFAGRDDDNLSDFELALRASEAAEMAKVVASSGYAHSNGAELSGKLPTVGEIATAVAPTPSHHAERAAQRYARAIGLSIPEVAGKTEEIPAEDVNDALAALAAQEAASADETVVVDGGADAAKTVVAAAVPRLTSEEAARIELRLSIDELLKVSSAGKHTYVPKHMKGANSKALPVDQISPEDLLASIESNFEDVLRGGQHARGQSLTEMIIDSEIAASQRACALSNTMAKVPEVDVDEVGSNRSIILDDHERRIREALAGNRNIEAAAAEIAEYGKMSTEAAAAAAMAAKNAGNHAALRMEKIGRNVDEPMIPVKRGPGFVDINDGTFVREGSPLVKQREGELKQQIPAIGHGRLISSTDSISDFPYKQMNKVYNTQGNMVAVEYPQPVVVYDDNVSRVKPEAAMASAATLGRVAALATLPIV